MFLNQLLRTVFVAATLTMEARAAPAPVNSSEYEYVVVGSGAGGGSLAATLARRGHSVFLIEAGGDHGDSSLQQIPMLSAGAAEDPESAWHYFVRHYRNETQARRDSKFTYLLEDGTWYTGLDPPEGAEPLGTYYPRGATVGGSTQVNAQGFVLSADNDWEYIADFMGDESWNAASMHNYFMDLENCTYLPPNSSSNHGFDGFISSRRNNISFAVDRPDYAAVLAHLELELSGTEVRDREHQVELMRRDINHADHHYVPGVYQDVVSVTNSGRRSGTWSYIRDTIDEGFPLTLSTHSLATRVLIDNGKNCTLTNPKAYGVEYMVGESLYAADQRYDPEQTGELRVVKAQKEVILAAGAFNTPQILKLSGIGPREELEQWEIPVVVDLPGVGANLQDHTEGVLIANASTEWLPGPFSQCNLGLNASDPCFVQWQEEGAGPYAEGASPQAVGIQTSESTTGKVDVWVVGSTGVMARGFEPGYSSPPAAPSSWAWIMVKVRPPGDGWSTGNVTLRSIDPRAVPSIDFDWLQGEAGERDLRAFTEASEVLMRGFDGAPDDYQPFVRHQPAEDIDPRQSFLDEAFGHHASSTCRMGPEGDSMACVDSQLRVKGVTNLRVADASVFPYTPGSFPALSIHLVGLKAADLLLGESGEL